jgi:alpha-tubulin suppressor-like RCC1 family protein
VVAITAGDAHTCALRSTGQVMCWGIGNVGQRGDGTTTVNQTTPIQVSGLGSGSGVVAIGAGGRFSCAVLMNGTAQCWGDGYYGQLGDNQASPRQNRLTPVTVSGLTNATAIVGGRDHACALLSNGGMSCWGNGGTGELGDGTGMVRAAPVGVSGLGSGVRAIDAGLMHTCAVLTNGGLRCWGRNTRGQVGDGTQTNRLAPVAVLAP